MHIHCVKYSKTNNIRIRIRLILKNEYYSYSKIIIRLITA